MFVVMTGNDPISDSQIKQDREAKKSEMGLPHWTKTNQVLDPRPTQPIFWGLVGLIVSPCSLIPFLKRFHLLTARVARRNLLF